MLNKRWYNVALGFAVLCVMALVVLGTVRLPGADVDLAVRTGVVHLRLAEEAQLPPFNTTRIQLVGDSTVEDLPGFTALRGSAEIIAGGGDLLSLARLVVPARGSLSLRRMDGAERGYELTMERGSAEDELAIEVVAQRAFSVVTGGKPTPVPAESPVAFRVSFKDRTATLRLVLNEASWSLMQPIAVTGLGLIDVLPTGRPAEFSGILEGSVHFPSSRTLAGEASTLVLRRGELLTLGRLEDASLAHLSLDGSDIEFGVVGTAHALATRWRNGTRDHMPTYLGWLASFDWLRAAVALLMTVAGGVLASPPSASAVERPHTSPASSEKRSASQRDPGGAVVEDPAMHNRTPVYQQTVYHQQPGYQQPEPQLAPPLPNPLPRRRP